MQAISQVSQIVSINQRKFAVVATSKFYAVTKHAYGRSVVKSRENAKRLLFFLLASIGKKKQSEHCMKEMHTHGTRFCAWCHKFCFCSHVLPEEKKLDCFTIKTSKGRFLLPFVWAYFLFAAGMRPTTAQKLCKAK